MIQNEDFQKLGYPPDGADADIGDSDDTGLDSPESELQQRINEEMQTPAYTNPNDIGHKAAAVRVQRLFQERAEGRDSRSAVEKACDDALEQQSQKQSADYDAAMADRDWLLENGFDSTSEPPDVVPEYLAQAWKMQRLRAEGDYANLGVMMEESLSVAQRQGRLPPGKASAILEFLHVETQTLGFFQDNWEGSSIQGAVHVYDDMKG